MYLNDYIKKYNYTFKEKPFNEVDNIILSLLSYLDFEGMVSDNKKDKITLEELSKLYFTKYPKYDFKEDITAKRSAFKIYELLIKSNRFKNIYAYNYRFVHNDDMQFGAITFEGDDFIYISFEGTDEFIGSWKEDFEMSYHFPTSAQFDAIKYLKKYTFAKKKIYVGGHSKGGNLALVASMYANLIIKRKIEKVYSNDGPGLRLKEIESKKYKSIKPKLEHIIPHTSFVGLLLRHDKDTCVKSIAPIIISHLPLTWQIEEDHFVRTNLSKSSSIINDGLLNWLNKYSYEEREKFTIALFETFKNNNIISLNQFKQDPSSIIKYLKTLLKVDSVVKNMSSDLINVLKETIKS